MKFLIAGLGSIGQRHLRNLISLGEQDIILYRTNKGTLENKEFARFPVIYDLQTALDYKPDAVIISNPTALHLDVAIPAAEAGCAILIEKPISHSMDNIEKLKTTAQRSGVRILVGFQFRFHANLRRIAHILNEKKIGDIVFVRAHYGEYLPAWHPWEDYRQSYSARADLGGGVIFTLCHPLDYLRWLIGDVEALWAFKGYRGGLNLQVEDSAEIGLRFANGVIGSVHLNYVQRPPSHTLEIIGTEGVIHWDYIQDIVTVCRGEVCDMPIVSPYTDIRNPMFLEEMRHFRAVVSGEEQPLCTLDDGIRTLELALAVHESANQGVIVRW
ncbi:MAG: Gfo/Idh/MocA family oxidoreductase [Chloroflexota bacterium]